MFAKKLAIDFGISFSYCHSLLWDTISKIQDDLFKNCVKWTGILDLNAAQNRFRDDPMLIGSVDATVQPINTSKKGDVNNKFYSGKHKNHVIKVQVIVNHLGQAIHVSQSVPGSIHDFSLLKSSGLIDFLVWESNKVVPLLNCYPRVYADRGYNGFKNLYNGAVVMIKKPRNRELNNEELALNTSITNKRIIVENWVLMNNSNFFVRIFKELY